MAAAREEGMLGNPVFGTRAWRLRGELGATSVRECGGRSGDMLNIPDNP
jgi:hypothetical protein